jgi:hypothetical protein
MKIVAKIEHSASSSRSKHEGESSFGLCDRLSRTRDNSQRQLPTDQDYAVSTREYQTDQSSLKTAPSAARSVLEQRRKQQQQTHRMRELTRSLHIRPTHSSRIIPETKLSRQGKRVWDASSKSLIGPLQDFWETMLDFQLTESKEETLKWMLLATSCSSRQRYATH